MPEVRRRREGGEELADMEVTEECVMGIIDQLKVDSAARPDEIALEY